MVLHPDVFLRAQAEVDRVTGHLRLPNFDDRLSMPYVECVLREVYRWGCPLPFGVPYRLVENDECRGYHLLAGSTIITNIWAMTRRTDVYPDPERFLPERFELAHGQTALHDPRKYIFGFGKRSHPGCDFADSSIWIVMVGILSALDVRKARNRTGEEISPVPAFKSGSVRHAAPFECDIRARPGKVMSHLPADSVQDSVYSQSQ
ncbi:uncharacterized protein FIBRA_01981 [Fibroporia radiculosa]|uniref:Cytochrome P450 n=1 Tax=Fibroporia radiculosa TaxID=599839 RepID=J4I8T2_9APHY|nr:uncharacterized protein FIBRA_01981 [Fibroporia radiculosa]CCL99956.1 predicted protein [Fibroporia radiculosa]